MPVKRTRAVTVLSLGLEGGGCRIMARQGPDGWVFWQTGTSMDIDLDDNETWTSFTQLAALQARKRCGWQLANPAPTQDRGCRQKSHLRSPLQAWSA
jgi:hypothetical protein